MVYVILQNKIKWLKMIDWMLVCLINVKKKNSYTTWYIKWCVVERLIVWRLSLCVRMYLRLVPVVITWNQIYKYSKSCIIWGRVTKVFKKLLVLRNKSKNKIKTLKSINLSRLNFLRRSMYNLCTSTHYLGVLSLSQHRNQQRRHIFHNC